MCIRIINTLTRKPGDVLSVKKHIICIIYAVSTLYKDSAAILSVYTSGGILHISYALHRYTSERLSLRYVWRYELCKWEQFTGHDLHRIIAYKLSTTGRHHHRVKHDILRIVAGKSVSYHINKFRNRYHSYLDRFRPYIGKHRIYLGAKYIRDNVHDSSHSCGILSREGCDRTHTKYAICLHGLEIRLHTCAT